MTFTVKLNGTDLPIKVKSVSGRGPLYQEIIRAKTNGPGSVFIKKRRTEVPMQIEYSISHNGINELRDKIDALQDLINIDKPGAIVFSDEPEWTYYGILEGDNETAEGHYKSDGVLNVIRMDPFKYKDEVIWDIIANNKITLNEPSALPVITLIFTGSTNDIKVTHNESGGFIRVIYGFIPGDILTIDLTKRKILINGAVNMTTYDIDSLPFEMKKGTNTFVIDQASLVTATVKYKPRR